MKRKPIRAFSVRAKPYALDGNTWITPVTRGIAIHPGLPIRLWWSRPAYIEVTHPDGALVRIKIPDRTRLIQLLILAAGFLIAVALRAFTAPKNPSKGVLC